MPFTAALADPTPWFPQFFDSTMSLKHFHFLFILFAAFFSLAFGAWGLLARDLDASVRGMAIFSVVLGVGLIAYGFWFRKKSRHVIT